MNDLISAFALSGGQIVSRSLLERWSRLTVTERFREPGYLEVVLPAEDAPAVDTVLTYRGRAYTVESVRREPATRLATVRAPGVLSLFSRRVLAMDRRQNGKVESVLRSLAQTSSAALPAPLRLIPTGETAVNEAMHLNAGTVLGSMLALATGADRGLSLTFDPSVPEFCFSSPRWTSGLVPLSEASGTLTGPVITEDFTEYKNRVRLQGQSSDGVFYPVSVLAEDCCFEDGFDDTVMTERWGYLAAPVATDGYVDGGTFNAGEYQDALRTMGRSYLAAHRPKREITGGIPLSVLDRIVPGHRVQVAVGNAARTYRVCGLTLTKGPGSESLSVDLG